jgi:hypothetical protein
MPQWYLSGRRHCQQHLALGVGSIDFSLYQ